MKGLIRAVFFSVCFVAYAFAEEASEMKSPPLPEAMAVLGDSISEGMMTEFSIERPPTFGQVFSILNMVLSAADSVQRMLLMRENYAKPAHSWATGDDESDFVFSHFERLYERNNTFKGFNFAVSGSKTENLKNQTLQLFEAERIHGVTIDYLVMMIGANDLKAEKVEEMVSPLQYVGNIEMVLREILNRNPERSVLLVGLPKIHDVFERSAKLHAYSILGIDYNCSEIRKQIYGDLILFKPDEKEPYEQSKLMVKQYQSGLSDLSRRLQREYPTAAIKVIEDYDAPNLAFKSLSIDCFHPSLWGQALLAELTWLHGFWPDLLSDDELLGL